MTGYAVLERELSGQTYRLHLKSVNHRFFELRWKSPRSWLGFETPSKQILQKTLERGSVDFWVESVSARGASEKKDLHHFFSKLSGAIEGSSGLSWILLPPPVRALILSRFPELWLRNESHEQVEFDQFKPLLEELLAELLKSRQIEGAGIGSALMKYAEEIENQAMRIRERLPQARAASEQDFRQRLQRLSEELKSAMPNEERLLQEYLMMAERREVSEELQRIDAHLITLKELLKSPRPQSGKRLEFLTQELHREWTTLGNKVHDASLSQFIIEAKLSIEKIREQTLNLS